MESIISSLRNILGEAVFYVNGELDFGLVFEYFVGSLVVLCVLCNVFRLIRILFGGN